MNTAHLATCSVAAAAAFAKTQAQVTPGYLEIRFEGAAVVTPTNPVATVSVWAGWNPAGPHGTAHFSYIEFDFRASEAGLDNATVILEPQLPNTWGTPGSSAYMGARFGQVHVPPAGIFASFDNPILLGTIDWRATDFTRRTVQLRTENEHSFRISVNEVGLREVAPIASGEAVITVLPCYADCDGNSTLDIFDFLCFQDAFIQSDPYADCDGSNSFDIFDFVCFQDEFVQGCP